MAWEYARYGDPAYEFAVVTRGVKRPFQIADGLARLLEAYQRHGGREVKAEHVHIHELAMTAGWYRTALNERGPNAAEQELDRMRGLLRRFRRTWIGAVRLEPASQLAGPVLRYELVRTTLLRNERPSETDRSDQRNPQNLRRRVVRVS